MSTLLFCDSFDHYTTAEIDKKWSSHQSSGIGAATGRNGTGAMECGRTYFYSRKNLGTTYATLYMGAAFKASNVFSLSGSPFFGFLDGITGQVYLTVNNSGHIEARRGAPSGSTLLGTGTATLQNGVYFYIEFKAVIDNTVGVVVVKVNGITDINLSGQDTQATANAYADTIALADYSNFIDAGTDFKFDDLYVTSDAFLGDVRVQAILPDGAGAHSQWTPSAGSNYQNVDDAAPNDDTDYNSDASAGDRDTFTYGPLVPTTGDVKGVQVLIYARKDDAGVRTIAPVVRHGGVDYDGTSVNIGTTYTYYSQIYDLNPGTGVAWTVANINTDDEFGVKLVA